MVGMEIALKPLERICVAAWKGAILVRMNSDKPSGDAGHEPEKSTSGAASAPMIYQSEELFQDRREVWIQHEGEMYRLRVTARGKLYLTK